VSSFGEEKGSSLLTVDDNVDDEEEEEETAIVALTNDADLFNFTERGNALEGTWNALIGSRRAP